jgi:hypothetical protein
MPWNNVGKDVIALMLETIEFEPQTREVIISVGTLEGYSNDWIEKIIKNLAIARNIKIDAKSKREEDCITILPAGLKRLKNHREQKAKNAKWKEENTIST